MRIVGCLRGCSLGGVADMMSVSCLCCCNLGGLGHMGGMSCLSCLDDLVSLRGGKRDVRGLYSWCRRLSLLSLAFLLPYHRVIRIVFLVGRIDLFRLPARLGRKVDAGFPGLQADRALGMFSGALLSGLGKILTDLT